MVSTEYDSSKPQEHVLFQQDSNNNLNELNEKNQGKKKYSNFSESQIEDGVATAKVNPTPSYFNCKAIQKYAELVGENLYFNFFMVLLTLWTLYQEDIRLAVVPKSGDTAFMIIASIIFFIYILEILILLMYKDDYFNFSYFKDENSKEDSYLIFIQSFFLVGSFYFWVDVISTAILIFDVSFISNSKLYFIITNFFSSVSFLGLLEILE